MFFCKEAEDEAIGSTVKIMETWFGHFGQPGRVRAGIGPTFCSSFTSWLKKGGTSKETDPASNSLDYRLTERAMWKSKEIIKKGMDEEEDWRANIKKMRDTASPIEDAHHSLLYPATGATFIKGHHATKIYTQAAAPTPGEETVMNQQTLYLHNDRFNRNIQAMLEEKDPHTARRHNDSERTQPRGQLLEEIE